MYGAGRVNFCRFSVCIDKSGKTYTLKVYVSVYVMIKPFEASKRSVKITIEVNFCINITF